MLGIGMSEILVIGVVVLLVVGPDKLPHLMRTVGRYYGQLRRSADELRRAFVLEADRQDADERMRALNERRKRAAEARRRAVEAAGDGAVAQGDDPPEADSAATTEDGGAEGEEGAEAPPEHDPDALAPHHADPFTPAGGDR
ncbi:MAG: sec-independent protein translocase protein TatB [Myxococcota bacterium]